MGDMNKGTTVTRIPFGLNAAAGLSALTVAEKANLELSDVNGAPILRLAWFYDQSNAGYGIYAPGAILLDEYTYRHCCTQAEERSKVAITHAAKRGK